MASGPGSRTRSRQHDHRAGAGGGPQLQVVALVEGDVDRFGVDARVEHLDDRVRAVASAALSARQRPTAAMMVALSRRIPHRVEPRPPIAGRARRYSPPPMSALKP